MSRSMTGYGRASVDFQSTPIEIEIRTVNHRHLDVRVRLPRSFGALDAPIKARVREHLDRGRVDVSLSFGDGDPLTPRLHVDVNLAGQYQAAAEQLSSEMRFLPCCARGCQSAGRGGAREDGEGIARGAARRRRSSFTRG